MIATSLITMQLMNVPYHSRMTTFFFNKYTFGYLLLLQIVMNLFLYVLHCKQATGNSVVTVGYVMKPSREEDFAKVSPI